MQIEKPIVIYDGECPFCIQQIERIKRFDTVCQFDYIPRQKDGLADRFPILKQSDFNTGMRFIQEDGSIDIGADAVYQIAKRIPPFHFIAWLYCLPGCKQLFRRVYAWIAANRNRLGKNCDSDQCNSERSTK